MRFFRRRSSPALVALLAIAMQAALVLAQTHTHSHVYTAGARAWAQGVASLACRAVVAPRGCPPTVPHNHGDACPMCSSLAAAGTAVLPAPIAPALLSPRFDVLLPLQGATSFSDDATVHFQARAPPIA